MASRGVEAAEVVPIWNIGGWIVEARNEARPRFSVISVG